jgi:prevent-host-death family protein
MVETSIAEARDRLTHFIYQAERGETVHITRRGRPVAVLLSEAEYGRLSRGADRPTFWDAIREMRADPEFEPIDLQFEEIESWRDRAAEDRGFEWPE